MGAIDLDELRRLRRARDRMDREYAQPLDATFEKVAGAPGAEVVQEPDQRSWGARDAAVRDLIRIEQA